MIFGIFSNLPVLLWRLLLDLIFGKAERFEYVSRTNPEEARKREASQR